MILFLLAGCGSKGTPSSTTGVEGHVTLGPTCPVQQAADPCPDRPYQAYLTVQDTHGRKVIRFQADAAGYYHIPLKPGEYVMHPESPNVMPYAADQPFTVLADQFTTLDIAYDSGIR